MKKVISAAAFARAGLALAGLALAGAATPALAHHSYAMFDFAKTSEIKGTVKEFKYTNPHSYIVLVPEHKTKADDEITIEANGPGYLVSHGWHRDSLKPGDMVVVSMNPLRDGAPGGSLIKVTYADGHILGTR